MTTLTICALAATETSRFVIWSMPLDQIHAVVSVVLVVWLIVSVLLLIESIRSKLAIPAAMFYVVTISTMYVTEPAWGNETWSHIIKLSILAANLLVQGFYLGRKHPLKTPSDSSGRSRD
ncbi:MAG: hypothetical protein K2Z81_26580 [Cyanobacteria bacterium]|nr:hypothetical protein [Cyanobacteriota bacterium]